MVDVFQIIPAFLVTLHGLFDPSLAVEVDRYIKCPRGLIANNSVQSYGPGRSALDCFQRCSQRQGCSSVNICPGGSSPRVNCELLYDFPSSNCEDLTSESSSLCYNAHKVSQAGEGTTQAEETTQTTSERTTTELVCQNGGTPNGNYCNCTIQYGGTTCNRFIRDCSEAYDRGFQTSYNGAYWILPVTAPSPFLVRCVFSWGGMTLAFRRSKTSTFNRDWDSCKMGFGDDLASNPSSFNFFIGLENLHHLLKQAAYELNNYVMYYPGTNVLEGGGAFYRNFTLGAESMSYDVKYDYFNDAGNVIKNGFSLSTPRNFSAAGNDVNGCYGQRNVAGWYDSSCMGYGMFTDGDFFWPVDGTDQLVDSMEFILTRTTPYYED